MQPSELHPDSSVACRGLQGLAPAQLASFISLCAFWPSYLPPPPRRNVGSSCVCQRFPFPKDRVLFRFEAFPLALQPGECLSQSLQDNSSPSCSGRPCPGKQACWPSLGSQSTLCSLPYRSCPWHPELNSLLACLSPPAQRNQRAETVSSGPSPVPASQWS